MSRTHIPPFVKHGALAISIILLVYTMFTLRTPGQPRTPTYQGSVPDLNVDQSDSTLRPQSSLHDAASNSTLGVRILPSCLTR